MGVAVYILCVRIVFDAKRGKVVRQGDFHKGGGPV